MIPRVLVPFNARPPAADAAPAEARRRTTELDSRTLVPAGMPAGEIDAQTSIPAYLPLDVLAARVVVPRDMPSKPLDVTSAIPSYVPLTILDSRVAVPKDAAPAKPVEPHGPVSAFVLPAVVEPDVITTGDVNLLVKPVEERVSAWQSVSRVASLVFHTALIVFILFEPKIFPYRPPTQEELELARRQLSFVYLPPETTDVPRAITPPSALKSPAMRINPEILRQLTPPKPELQPNPGPEEKERVTRDLPNPPAPNLPARPTPQMDTRGDSAPQAQKPEAPKIAQAPGQGLILPNLSPGRALQESVRGAIREPGVGTGMATGGPIPGGPGGGGGAQAFGALQMLTPTEGVDFTNYLARVLASVKRSWYAVIPESARMGEKGMVVLQFRIMRDGSVPSPEPNMVGSSGKEPLDRAAYSAIRSSSPFEQLPPAFSGPFIELRFIFLYNLPLDYVK
jgi:TonB family protein